MKLTQVEAARLMAAHEKVVTASIELKSAARYLSAFGGANNEREYRKAKQAFAELVSKLTEPE
jgi:hypothetical protein